MRVDIIEVNNKKFRVKLIVIFIITLVLIAVFSLLGIYCAQKYKTNYMLGKKQNIIENTIQSEIQQDENKINIENIIQEETEPNENIETENTKINYMNNINNIYNKETKIAYLTFDDGPSQAVTPLILDVLKEENIKATFFVLGTNVKQNPDILKREYQEGHYIANHGYTHNYSKIYKNADTVLEEYNKTEKAIQEALGNKEYSSNLFRFPGGYTGGKYESIKKKAGEILKENNIAYIDWNVLTKDAEGANTKEKILSNLKKYSKDKGNIVVLMHDASSKILTYETLKDVINYLREQGYTFDNFYSIMQ